MPQKRKPDQSKVIITAALDLADRIGWDHMTLQDIARKIKTSESAINKIFPHPHNILREVLKNIDTETEKDVKKRLGTHWRDNLFEILMTRFDLLQKHRKGFLTILPMVMRAPETGLHLSKHFYETMDRMLLLAGLPKKLIQPAYTMALGALYLSITHVWSRDETPDLAKTMAVIDRRLNILEQFISMTTCGTTAADE